MCETSLPVKNTAVYHLQVAEEAQVVKSREIRLDLKKICYLLDRLERIQVIRMNSRQIMQWIAARTTHNVTHSKGEVAFVQRIRIRNSDACCVTVTTRLGKQQISRE